MKSYLLSQLVQLFNWTNNLAKIVTVLLLLLFSTILVVFLMFANALSKVCTCVWHASNILMYGLDWCIRRFSAGIDWLGSCLFGCIDDIYNSLD